MNECTLYKNFMIDHRSQFRVGNMRLSHLIETHVGAQLIHHKRTTKEGDSLSFDMEELSLNTQTYFGRSEFDDLDDDDFEGSKDEEPSRVRQPGLFGSEQLNSLKFHWLLESAF